MTDVTTDIIDFKRDRLVIIASTLGTMFEWYDFFIYATIAPIIAKLFFPAANETASLLFTFASFGVGFGVRPFGALVFGVLGDRLGRKATFLITISLMGGATAAIGLVPGFATIGLAAPITLVILRALQGLALGGEYGGAAVYVAEHAPANRRGLYTSFIQAGVTGGLMLSLIVVLATSYFVGKTAWAAWGWRVPFLLSVVLLGLSLYIRLQLSESPVFKAMKAAGETAQNPLRETFNSPAKVWRMIAAMIGIAAGFTVIWYSAQLQSLYFLQNALRIEDTSAQRIVVFAAFASLFWFILFGWLSDLVGRKVVMLTGYLLALLMLFPLFHMLAGAANPQLALATAKNPIVVTGSDCTYKPFAAATQMTSCGKLIDILSRKGLAYTTNDVASGTAPSITIGSVLVDSRDKSQLESALQTAGYRFEKVTPTAANLPRLLIAVLLITMLSGITYAPVAAYLVELFPGRVRYTSLSISYHMGAGYFGGFLPLISQFIVAKTGDPFAWIWYTLAVVAAAFVLQLVALPETAGKELE